MSRFTLRRLVKDCPPDELKTLYMRWNGRDNVPDEPRTTLARLGSLMEDEERVEQRLKELPEKLVGLLNRFLADPGQAQDVPTIAADAEGFRSRYDVEASLVALQREGFLFPWRRPTGSEPDGANGVDGTGYAVPGELAQCIEQLRQRGIREVLGALTLRGYLEQRYFDAAKRQDDPERAADHARKVYKIYLMGASIENRVSALPEPVRAVFDRAVSAYGGLLPLDQLQLDDEDDSGTDADLVKKCLQDNMLGTVGTVRLARFGLRPIDVVVVFHEIVLYWLQRESEEERAQPGDVLSGGVDLVTNVGRFLRSVSHSKVQFTVDGQLYKASAKRIAKDFLDVPGGFMPADTQIRFIYSFCLSRRLIERSGERALRLSEAGARFEQASLQEKLKSLVAYAVEERSTQGEHYHQVRLRRILLRLFRRVEEECWYEVLYVPFLARNTYLTKLDELQVEEFFAARFKGGGYEPSEDVHRIALRLLDFVKRRLYPLGVVDLGLVDGRPVALRLSRLGADLLVSESAGDVGGARSTVVVNPDFEAILFPGEDEHEVVHSFDRFAERMKTDHIHHFRITRDSVQAALEEGLSVGDIVQELTDRSRTPLPQNVLYSLEDWAEQAGLFALGDDRSLRCRRPEQMDRLLAHTRLRELIGERESETCARVRADADLDGVARTARDLGFLVERRSE